MNPESLTYLENMRIAQARIHLGDPRFFVTSANGWVVRGPFMRRRQAQAALNEIRAQAWKEDAEDGGEMADS